jgi:iron(III) transport system ATP-binding protein
VAEQASAGRSLISVEAVPRLRAHSEKQDDPSIPALTDETPALRYDDACCRLGGHEVVRSVDLTLCKGEILTLLGPSGSGKTTLLRMAMGLERCTRGSIVYDGRPIDDPARKVFLPTERRRMGMIFQAYAVWPHMTVFDNVAFPLKIQRRPKAEIRDRVAQALALVDLSRFADRPVPRLSGGQQQRVAIARAIVSRPSVLLADEPFSNLDGPLREQMRSDLKALQRQLGFATLFVTHDQGEALSLSHRIAVIHGGQVEQIGTPVDLYSTPRTALVRDFIGRWLRLPCEIAGGNADYADVRIGDGRVIRAKGGGHEKLSSGAKALMTIRPESVRVSQSVGAALEENAVRGVIEVLNFLGHGFEAVLALPGGERVATTLGPDASWQEGQVCDLLLPPEAIRLWPEG